MKKQKNTFVMQKFLSFKRFTKCKKNASLKVRKSQKIFFLVFNYLLVGSYLTQLSAFIYFLIRPLFRNWGKIVGWMGIEDKTKFFWDFLTFNVQCSGTLSICMFVRTQNPSLLFSTRIKFEKGFWKLHFLKHSKT